jgi:polysaccharide biosynthesis transport protein
VGLSDYLHVIYKRRRLILITTVTATLVALVVSLLLPKQYLGEAKVLVSAQNTGVTLVGSSLSGDSNQPGGDLQTQIQLMQQRPLAESVIRSLGLSDTPESLLERVKITADGQASIVTIHVTGGDPSVAAATANGLAAAYLSWSRELQRSSIQAAANQVQQRIADAQKQIASLGLVVPEADPSGSKRQQLSTAKTLYDELARTLQQLQLAEQLVTGSGSVVASAVPDPSPVSPSPVRNTAIGLVLGLMLGIGLAFAAETLDTRVKSSDQASELYGAPVLTGIATEVFNGDEGRRLTVLTQSGSPAAEGYRRLRNSLNFLNFEHKTKAILVTSAMPGEGKSTVAANLAVVMAQAGWNVVLVVCDFRQPTTDEFFDLSGRIGLSEVLAGSADIASVLQQPAEGPERLSVVTSGAMPPNPSELLGSASMQRLLTALGKSHDYVILDSPPVLSVADAAAAARLADGVIMVANLKRSTRDSVVQARDQLEKVGANILGVVVLGVPDSTGGGYGYAMSSSAAEPPSPPTDPRRDPVP